MTDPAPNPRVVPVAELDHALTAQIIIAWAGEKGEDPRLGWWRCDLVSEFGGEDLFKRLLPNTWDWAVLQGAREAIAAPVLADRVDEPRQCRGRGVA